jgi:hypothetical protein
LSNVAILRSRFQPAEASFAENTASGVVLLAGNNRLLVQSLNAICDFLGFGVHHLPDDQDIAHALGERRPMAVIVEAEGQHQDGYHVMMAVAEHDSRIPVMVLTGRDPALMGAADAIQELWGLESVALHPRCPEISDLVDFLFRASQHAGRGGLMPI